MPNSLLLGYMFFGAHLWRADKIFNCFPFLFVQFVTYYGSFFLRSSTANISVQTLTAFLVRYMNQFSTSLSRFMVGHNSKPHDFIPSVKLGLLHFGGFIIPEK